MPRIAQKLNFNSVTETIFTFAHHWTDCMAVKSKWRVLFAWRRLTVIFTNKQKDGKQMTAIVIIRKHYTFW